MKTILLLFGIFFSITTTSLPAQKTAEVKKITRHKLIHPQLIQPQPENRFNRKAFPYKWWRLLLSTPLTPALHFYGKSGGWGIGGYIESQFSITKHISVGFLLRYGVRTTSAANGNAFISALNTLQQNIPVRITRSQGELLTAYQLTADYHFFPEHKRRLYAGLSIGVLHAPMGLFSDSIKGDKNINYLTFENPALGKQQFSVHSYQRPRLYALISPRVGIDFNHFRLGLVYNLVIGNRQPAFQATGYTPLFDPNNNKTDNARITLRRGNLNHLSLQCLFYIGGGRQKLSARKAGDKTKSIPLSDSLKSAQHRWRLYFSPLIGGFHFYAKNGGWGSSAYIEPQLSLTPHVAIGFLFQFGARNYAANGNAAIHPLNAPQNKNAVLITDSRGQLIMSYQLTADYYFYPERKRRWYAGIGAGILHALNGTNSKERTALTFNNAAIGKQEFTTNTYPGSKWYPLISPRIGIDFKYLRLGLVYNLVISRRQPDFQAIGYTALFDPDNNKNDNAQITLQRSKLNHLSLQFLFYIGGQTR